MIHWFLNHTAHLIGGLGGIIVSLITHRGLRLIARYRVTRNGQVTERSVGVTLNSRAEDSPEPGGKRNG